MLVASSWAWCRSLGRRPQPGAITASLVGVFSLVVVIAGLRLAYVAPLAIIQDFVAARALLKGEPLPTTEIKPIVKEILAEEPRPPSLELIWPRVTGMWPEVVRQEQREYDKIASIINEQAHPPFAIIFVVPFLYFLGLHCGSLAFSLLSVLSLGITLFLIDRVLKLNLSRGQKVFFSSHSWVGIPCSWCSVTASGALY